MKYDDPFEIVRQLSRIQRLAGVDRETRELYVAYARLRLDAGKEVPDFSSGRIVGDPQDRDRRYVPASADLNEADPRFRAFVASYSKAMIGRRMPVVLSIGHLARKMGISVRQLMWISWNHDALYRRHTIPKSSGGERIIHAPVDKLKAVQQWIYRRILAKARVHDSATGFRRGVSIVDNARRHTGRNVVVRIDLKDFFPTITHRQVRQVFESLGYPYSVANVLANICSLGGTLPQGAPTSPALANLVCRTLDNRLRRLSAKWKCRYTRYADDLVFSSRRESMPDLIPFIKTVIASEGFVVNEDKVRVMRKGTRQKVTGLVVNQKPDMSREQRRRLRAMAHRMATRGPSEIYIKDGRNPDADPVHVLQGHIAFLSMVNPGKGECLARLVDKGKRARSC